MALRLEIVTPEARIFSDEVDSVVLPGTEGELGILPEHAPLISTLKPGELAYSKGGKEDFLAVGEGFVEVTQSAVTVLTDMAVREEEIEEAAVEDAIRRAEEALEGIVADEEIALAEAAIAKAIAKLALKRKRRRHL